MLQAKWFVASLLVLCSASAVAIQNNPATAGAKKAGAALTSGQPVVPEPRSLKQVPRPVAMNHHGFMAAQHPGLSYPLSQANLPSSGKVHSFPVLAKASFFSPVDVHPSIPAESKTPQIDRHKLLMARPPVLPTAP